MNVNSELQQSRITAVQRKITQAMHMASELGKVNARQGYNAKDNPFTGYPLEAIRVAWLSGWSEVAESEER